ncbi:PilX N-terminal domain-containing pilus assembly protein [Halopseudomonas sp.]|uniref:pilus assembly PilX family protein n=1 Tax=Halopseudomonas sp. TaxID=2901191 RepID=UPI00356B4642
MKNQAIGSERGAVLLISLVFLLLLTVIGLSAIQGATLQERMAGNARDINVAFQSAETALRAAEVVLQQASLPEFQGSNGLYLVCADTESTATACKVPDWASAQSTTWVPVTGVDEVARQPQYYIQKYISVYDIGADLAADEVPPIVDVYKVVARGFGVSDTSLAAIETTYRRD